MRSAIVTSFLISLFLVAGCSNDNLVVNPVQKPSYNKTWLKLPVKQGLSVETQYTFSKLIIGKKGGDVKFDQHLQGEYGELRIQGKLHIPKHAFADNDTLLFSVIIDDATTSVTFEPSPYYFNQNLQFDIQYKGIDISGIDPNSLDFAYIAEDGTIQPAQFDKIEVKENEHKIQVKKAIIPHFSRYGFVR